MASRWFIHELRVRYQETDQMGVVYHVNYLNWFEIGRTELIRELGLPYQELEERGLLLPVTEADIKYHKPAKYDDWITVRTRIEEFTHVRLQFANEVLRGDERLVSGGTSHMWVNSSWKPARIDRAAPDLYELLKTTVHNNSDE